MIPKRLEMGDMVGLISPAIAADESFMQEACRGLQSMGLRTLLAPNLFHSSWGYAASARERAEDFHTMLNNNEVRLILFSGGEVSNEVLPFLDFELMKKNSKIICSYSDSTTLLNAIYTKTGLVTYYGISPRTFRKLTPYNRSQFTGMFYNGDARPLQQNKPWKTVYRGRAKGILIGGYLENFALLAEGRYIPRDPEQKYILFLEDHISFHQPAAVARYLSNIEQSDFFRQVSGLIFGNYSEAENPELLQILERFSGQHALPAVRCDDFGHGTNNAVLPIGIQASLDANKTQLIFEEKTVQ